MGRTASGWRIYRGVPAQAREGKGLSGSSDYLASGGQRKRLDQDSMGQRPLERLVRREVSLSGRALQEKGPPFIRQPFLIPSTRLARLFVSAATASSL